MTLGFRTLVALLFTVVLAACGKDGLFGTSEPQEPQSTACVTDYDCAMGASCEHGSCRPCLGDDCGGGGGGGGGGGSMPSIAGDWTTNYHFDWSDYLGPLADLGTPLDFLDQLLMGNSDISDLPLVGELLQSIIDQYIPEWVRDLVHFLNQLVHFFQDVRIEGRMVIVQGTGSPAPIGANEVWDWGYVQMIDQCPLGESDPGYPGCAEVAVPMNYAITGFGTIAATALPMSGTYDGTTVRFDDREVQMELSDFLRFIIDWGVTLATDGLYDSLEAALLGVVDCVGITLSIQNAMCNSFNMCGALPMIEAACIETRDQVISEILADIDAVTVDWEAMQFDQRAAVIDQPANGVAERLGTEAQPGIIDDGSFNALLEGELTGTWTAIR